MNISHTAQLRMALNEITKDGTSPTLHPEAIANLASHLPHSIVLAPPRLMPANCSAPFNCFEFALGLAGRTEVRLISHYLSSTRCNGEFVAHLVTSVLAPIATPRNCDLVLYKDGIEFTHAGVVHGGRVLSKWGTGQLWIHETLEVPAKYGDSISHFRAADAAEMLVEFIEFARNREGAGTVADILNLEPHHNGDA